MRGEDEYSRDLTESLISMKNEEVRLRQLSQEAGPGTTSNFPDRVIDVREKLWLLQEVLDEYSHTGEENRYGLRVVLQDSFRRLEESIKWAWEDYGRP